LHSRKIIAKLEKNFLIYRVEKLGAYDKQNIMLTLPKDKTLRDIEWIAVWCQLFTVSQLNL